MGVYYEQIEELMRRASVVPEAPEAETDEQQQFRALANALVSIHGAKAVHYGDYLKTHGDESVQLFAVQHFCDIKRKYVRAKTFIERMTRGEKIDFTDLLDTYSDLAVYAIMGLQMAFHCRDKSAYPEILNAKWEYATSLPDVVPPGRSSGAHGCCSHGILYTSECSYCKEEDIPF